MKKKKETIIQGIIALLFSQVLIKFIGLVYKLYLTNREGFGDSGNAIYASGFQIYALLLTFSSTGVPNAIAKIVSQRMAVGDSKGAHRIFKIAFFTFAIFGIIGTILLFLGAKIISNKLLLIPEAKYSLVALSPSIFFVSITSVIRGYFNGRQKLSVTAKSQSIEQLFKTIFTVILVELIVIISGKNTVLMAASANLATTIATFFSFAYIYLYYKSQRSEISQEINQTVNYTVTRIRKTIKQILSESIPISLSALMSTFNKNIDAFTVVRIMKKYVGERMAKTKYGILSGKIDTLCILPLSINVAFVTGMVPSISKSVARNNFNEVNKKSKMFLIITFIIAIISTIFMICFSDLILKTLFPNASEGTVLLKINSISIFFALMSQTVNSILHAIGKTKTPVISSTIGVIIKLISNILLIRDQNIGINGAAIGNIMCNLINFMISFIVLKYYFFKKNKYFQKKRGNLSKIGE